jgi:hypothetical protein
VELHLDGLEGPVVGTAVAGTFLPVLGTARGATKVAITAFAGAPPAFVESDALGVAAAGKTEAPSGSEDYFDWSLPIGLTPEAVPFASTGCGPIHVEALSGVHAKVSQYREGVSLSGWTDHLPPRRRNTESCRPRIVEWPAPSTSSGPPALPAGYEAVPTDPALQDPLGEVMRTGGALYWPINRMADDSVTCLEWQVKPAASKTAGLDRFDRVTELHRPRAKNDPFITDYELEYVGRQGALLPTLSIRSRPGPQADEECDGTYTIVSILPAGIRLVRERYVRGLAGYQPQDTEDWYLSRAACEAAAVRLSGPGPGLNRVRVGC